MPRTSAQRGRARTAARQVLVLGLVLGTATAAARCTLLRLEVDGWSMAPTLLPGDRVVAVRLPRRWPLRPGWIVAARDPRTGPDGPIMIKRVVPGTASPPPGSVRVEGDNAAASTDSRTFGPVARRLVLGPAIYRYAPPGRSGWLPGTIKV